jgi:hypothetical protein
MEVQKCGRKLLEAAGIAEKLKDFLERPRHNLRTLKPAKLSRVNRQRNHSAPGSFLVRGAML